MNRFATFSLAAALAACGAALAAAPARGENIFPYPYQTETLPNGLTVVTIPMASQGLVSYWTIVRTGSRDEVEPHRSGYAHFFEHMMFRGTKKYPGALYDRIVTGLGAHANAFTTDDFTAFHLTITKDDLEEVIEIESDRFQNLFYDQSAFQTEAGAIYGEYRKDSANPFFLLDEKLRDAAFDVSTYKHSTMGFEADVKAMPQGFDYSRSFFQRFYRPENVVVLVVGDVDPAKTREMIAAHYGSWKRGYRPPEIQPEPPQKGPRSIEVAYPGQTLPVLDVAYKGAAFSPANRDLAAAVLLGELAFGSTSDLSQKLVLRQQKAEALMASIPINRDMPLFEIAAIVKRADDIPYVRDEIYRTLAEYAEQPVGAARLDAVKRHKKYAFLMGLDSPERVANALARWVAMTGGVGVVDQWYAELDRVTPDDVIRATRKYFDANRRTVAVLKGTNG